MEKDETAAQREEPEIHPGTAEEGEAMNERSKTKKARRYHWHRATIEVELIGDFTMAQVNKLCRQIRRLDRKDIYIHPNPRVQRVQCIQTEGFPIGG